jgi:uncharacterized protein with GYD domain
VTEKQQSLEPQSAPQAPEEECGLRIIASSASEAELDFEPGRFETEESAMPKYIMLGHLTDQGVRHAKEAPKRKEVFLDLAKTFGATVEAVYWTMGLVVIDAPDDTAMTTLSISLGVRGNGRTQTLRAFEDADVEEMLKNVVTP